MSTKTRPDGCCDIPNEPIALPATEQERLVGMFKALSDPTRFDIFRLVAAQDAPICACDVVDRFQVSQPTISHHMKVLRDAGLVNVSRRGVWAYYAANQRGLELLRESIDTFAPSLLLAAG
jgi:ArsR family transcriptional regulator